MPVMHEPPGARLCHACNAYYVLGILAEGYIYGQQLLVMILNIASTAHTHEVLSNWSRGCDAAFLRCTHLAVCLAGTQAARPSGPDKATSTK